MRLARLERLWAQMVESGRLCRNCGGREEEEVTRDVKPATALLAGSEQVEANPVEASTSGLASLSSISAVRLIAEATAALHAQGQYGTDIGAMGVNTRSSQDKSILPTVTNEDLTQVALQPQPSEQAFRSLLEAYSRRLFPFFPAVTPSEAQAAFRLTSTRPPFPGTTDPTAAALTFAVMACGVQTLPAPPTDGNDATRLYQQAVLWMSCTEKSMMRRQTYVLLAYFSASRGNVDQANEWLDKAQILLVTKEEPDEAEKRLEQSLDLLCQLVDYLQHKLSPCPQAPIPRNVLSPPSSDLFCCLLDLSRACSSSGTVGRALTSIVNLTCSHPAYPISIESLHSFADESLSLLERWYSSLPLQFRSSPGPEAPVTLAIGSCIAFVMLQFHRLRLCVALRKLDVEGGGRCRREALYTLRALPVIGHHLPSCPWLMIYAESVAMAAGWLVLEAAQNRNMVLSAVVGEVEAALCALKRVERSKAGVAELVKALGKLVEGLRSRMITVAGAKRSATDADSETGCENKRTRSATMPQIRTADTMVSPITRPETAPPVHPPLRSSANAPTDPSGFILNLPVQLHGTNGSSQCVPPMGWPIPSLDDFWQNSAAFFSMPTLPSQQGPGSAQQSQTQSSTGQIQEEMMSGLLKGLIANHEHDPSHDSAYSY